MSETGDWTYADNGEVLNDEAVNNEGAMMGRCAESVSDYFHSASKSEENLESPGDAAPEYQAEVGNEEDEEACDASNTNRKGRNIS